MSERESNGRFGKGNQAAKGNNGGRPRRSVEEQSLAILAKVATPESLEKLFASGLSRAMAGDVAWARLILGYLVGLPIERKEISGPDGGPVEMAVKGYVSVSPDDWPSEP